MRKFTRAGFVKSLLGASSAPLLMLSNGGRQNNAFGAHLNEDLEIAGSSGPSTDHLRTFGTAGKEELLHPGHELPLFSYDGDGCLTHMWFGGDWPGYGSTRIRFYVDEETKPSIDMQLFAGHGIGWDDPSAPWGSKLVGKTGQPSGLYNTYRIPFGKSIRITGQLAKTVESPQPFWWIFRGVENLPVQLGQIQLPKKARLRLQVRENVMLDPLQMFEIGESPAAGALYQVMLAVRSKNFSYLEAMLRANVDGAKEPLMLSSGTEDYFLGTYYFNRGLYHLPLAGLTHKAQDQNGDCSFSAYRFHDEDPIFFHQGLRLSWRNGEEKGGNIYGPGPPGRSQATSYVWMYEW
ncbi:MAG: DUF2961 domain-containing protein [Terriglobia bacterium]